MPSALQLENEHKFHTYRFEIEKKTFSGEDVKWVSCLRIKVQLNSFLCHPFNHLKSLCKCDICDANFFSIETL